MKVVSQSESVGMVQLLSTAIEEPVVEANAVANAIPLSIEANAGHNHCVDDLYIDRIRGRFTDAISAVSYTHLTLPTKA